MGSEWGEHPREHTQQERDATFSQLNIHGTIGQGQGWKKHWCLQETQLPEHHITTLLDTLAPDREPEWRMLGNVKNKSLFVLMAVTLQQCSWALAWKRIQAKLPRGKWGESLECLLCPRFSYSPLLAHSFIHSFMFRRFLGYDSEQNTFPVFKEYVWGSAKTQVWCVPCIYHIFRRG